ncbi:MAG TPA: hypothetical protein VIK33_05910 [Anaerolineae bacterium]
MAGMTLEAFESQVTSTCAVSPIVISVSIVAAGVAWLCLRAHLSAGSFVDAFYNEATGRTSFALIKDGHRIFGADNTGRWHWHPFEAPDSHAPASESVAFDDFLNRIEEYLKP